MSECNRNFYFFNNTISPTRNFKDDILSKGQSIYEVLKVKESIPLFFEKHLERLKKSTLIDQKQLLISDVILKNRIHQLIKLNESKEDTVKIVMSYNNDFFDVAQNILLLYLVRNPVPLPEDYENGVNTISYHAERINPNAKIIHYEQRIEISNLIASKKVSETILVDSSGNVTEGSRSNLFFIKDNILYTPPGNIILEGITRKNVFEICRNNNIPIREIVVPYSQISDYQSCFITGTSRKVLPVKTIDNFTYNIANSLLRKLMFLYDNKIAEYIASNQNDEN